MLGRIRRHWLKLVDVGPERVVLLLPSVGDAVEQCRRAIRLHALLKPGASPSSAA